VTARFRAERKVQDFAATKYDIFLDISDDGGKSWKNESSVKGTSPEEHGPVWLPVKRDAVRNARLRVERKVPPWHWPGFTEVRLYVRE